MPEITREQKCKAIVEACGGHWHEWEWLPSYEGGEDLRCKICDLEKIKSNENLTFSNPADLLKMMMTRSDWGGDFGFQSTLASCGNYGCIDISHITEPDKLLNAAFEWVSKKGNR